jgi:predicted transcriptional regulator
MTRTDTTPNMMPGAIPRTAETAEERQQRLVREAEMIAEAEAEVAAGRTVSLEAVQAWVASLDTAHPLPVPQSGR